MTYHKPMTGSVPLCPPHVLLLVHIVVKEDWVVYDCAAPCVHSGQYKLHREINISVPLKHRWLSRFARLESFMRSLFSVLFRNNIYTESSIFTARLVLNGDLHKIILYQ